MLVVLEFYQTLVFISIGQVFELLLNCLIAGRYILNSNVVVRTSGIKSGSRGVLEMKTINFVLAHIHHSENNLVVHLTIRVE